MSGVKEKQQLKQITEEKLGGFITDVDIRKLKKFQQRRDDNFQRAVKFWRKRLPEKFSTEDIEKELRKARFEDAINIMFEGEQHPFKLTIDENGQERKDFYHYLGPGTKLIQRLRDEVKPINKIDEAGFIHDIDYTILSLKEKFLGEPITSEEVRESDERFANTVSENWSVDPITAGLVLSLFTGKKWLEATLTDPSGWVKDKRPADTLDNIVVQSLLEIEPEKFGSLFLFKEEKEKTPQRKAVEKLLDVIKKDIQLNIEFSKEFVEPSIIEEKKMATDFKKLPNFKPDEVRKLIDTDIYSKTFLARAVNRELDKLEGGKFRSKKRIRKLEGLKKLMDGDRMDPAEIEKATIQTFISTNWKDLGLTAESGSSKLSKNRMLDELAVEDAGRYVPEVKALLKDSMDFPIIPRWSSRQLQDRIPGLSDRIARSLSGYFGTLADIEESGDVSLDNLDIALEGLGVETFNRAIREFTDARFSFLKEGEEGEEEDVFEDALEVLSREEAPGVPPRPSGFFGVLREGLGALIPLGGGAIDAATGLPLGTTEAAAGVLGIGAPPPPEDVVFGRAQSLPATPRVRGEAEVPFVQGRPPAVRPKVSIAERRKVLREKQQRGESLTTREMKELFAPVAASERIAVEELQKSEAAREERLDKKGRAVSAALTRGKAYLDIYRVGDDVLQAPTKTIVQPKWAIRKPNEGDNFPVGSDVQRLDMGGTRSKQLKPNTGTVAPMKTRKRWRGMTNNPLAKVQSFSGAPTSGFTIANAPSSFVGDNSLNGVLAGGYGVKKPLMVGASGKSVQFMDAFSTRTNMPL